MLSNRVVKQFREQGYALISGIFTAKELDEMEREFDGILARRLKGKANLEATWGGNWRKGVSANTQLLHTHDVQAYSAVWAKTLFHARLTRAMSELMGSPNIQLHHTKLFLKPPEKGSAFPMHQDYPYFPHEKHTMMAGIIHLSDATPKMGCVCVYPETNKLGPLKCFEHNHLDPKEYPIEKATSVAAKRGDVVFFNYLTIHGSGVNLSKHVRKTVLIQVRDPDDRPLDTGHPSNAQGMILRGIDPLTDRSTADNTLELRG